MWLNEERAQRRRQMLEQHQWVDSLIAGLQLGYRARERRQQPRSVFFAPLAHLAAPLRCASWSVHEWEWKNLLHLLLSPQRTEKRHWRRPQRNALLRRLRWHYPVERSFDSCQFVVAQCMESDVACASGSNCLKIEEK